MKNKLYTFVCGLALLAVCSCSRDVYKRPVTVDRLEFKNTAGAAYEEQFRQVNSWYLQKFDSIQTASQLLVVNTASKKKYHKLNYTLVASLDSMNLNDKPGVYYQLYFRPNSGAGKMKGGVQQDMYNELKLYSPASFFLQHGQAYYRDSVLAGATTKIIPAHELLLPANTGAPGIKSFEIEQINFFEGLRKKQQNSLIRILNNAIVLKQQQYANKAAKYSRPFDYYANWLPGSGKVPATYAITIDVTEDAAANEIRVKLTYKADIEAPRWLNSEAVINRRDFLDGHTYEANSKLSSLMEYYIMGLYAAKPRQK